MTTPHTSYPTFTYWNCPPVNLHNSLATPSCRSRSDSGFGSDTTGIDNRFSHMADPREFWSGGTSYHDEPYPEWDATSLAHSPGEQWASGSPADYATDPATGQHYGNGSTSYSVASGSVHPYGNTTGLGQDASVQYDVGYDYSDQPGSGQADATFLTQKSEAGALYIRIQEDGHKKYLCRTNGCTAHPFGRVADLDRHHRMLHVEASKKESFTCDYKKCPRYKQPFYRHDHFRDHLREYHREDVLKRGNKETAETLLKRNISPDWWRCCKCLVRVTVSDDGWECPKCRATCQAERIQARRLKANRRS